MAISSPEIVFVLLQTATRLERSASYQWGHMGNCNCGFLVQEVLRIDKAVIHSSAMERSGDWTEQLNDYCPTSGLKIDAIISTLLSVGFTPDDLKHLERLSDPQILLYAGSGTKKHFHHNRKEDVVSYLRSWASMLQVPAQLPVAKNSPVEDKEAHSLLACIPG
jgi:hypothetical protein